MQKTKIIKEIVGERLKEYGFNYLKTDGPCRIFMRELQGIKRYYDPENQTVKQYINIQESGFGKDLTVRFRTDVFGYEMEQGLEELKKYGTGGWLTYLDEEKYKERLSLLTDYIIEQGFDLLEKMSHEEEIIPTKAMAEKLFNEHKQLADAFLEEFSFKTVPGQPEDIDEWFDRIKKMLMDSADLPYDEVKELLVKIAAFIGEKACEMCSCEWLFPAHFMTPEIIGPGRAFLLLDVVVDGWKSKCDEDTLYRLERIAGTFKQGMAK